MIGPRGPKSNRAPSGLLRHLVALLAATCLLASARVSATDSVGTAFLCEKSKEADVVTLPSGLRYKVIESGDGTFHPAADSPTVTHYAGTLIDGTEFDSSYARGKPATFAPNKVIKGWTEAMQLMVEGDKWELYIPSELAYGSGGSAGAIPADAALVFTIEMIEIEGDKVPASDQETPPSPDMSILCPSDLSEMGETTDDPTSTFTTTTGTSTQATTSTAVTASPTTAPIAMLGSLTTAPTGSPDAGKTSETPTANPVATTEPPPSPSGGQRFGLGLVALAFAWAASASCGVSW